MNDLAILHLSDLHIDDTGVSYSKPLQAMLADIKSQIASIPDKKLVVVVTGDIINMGEKKALGNAKKFFRRLKDVTEEKLAAIYIVPGNHDKKRTNINEFLIHAYRGLIKESMGGQFAEHFRENLWGLQDNMYIESGYTELIDYIYNELFDMPQIGEIARKTYGVHVLNIANKRFCFGMLNTAWSCGDNLDTRRLIIGKFQLNEIKEQFHKLTDEEDIDMTFLMGHHPIESLYGTEQDDLFAQMISYTEMNANAYLCGHTHDRNVVNWSNNRHAIYTLMTGFGWPEKDGNRVHDHYYSIYIFNIDINSMDIYVRKTNDGSEFIPDLSIYTGKTNQDRNKLVRPIRFIEAQGAVPLSAAKGMPVKTAYASESFLTYSRLFHTGMRQISKHVYSMIQEYKLDVMEEWQLHSESETEKLDATTRNIFLKNDDQDEILLKDQYRSTVIKAMLEESFGLVCDNFQGFFQRLSQMMYQWLKPELKPGQIIRFHFRYLADKSTLTYSTLCTSFSLAEEEEGEEEEKNRPTDIKYCDLLEAAFNAENTECLIYSVNKDICKNSLKEKWNDFITVVPKFKENIYVKPVGKFREKEYPYITFGVTISDSEHRTVLHCMDFYHIDEYISEFVQQYIRVFQVDLGKFVTWLKKDTLEA